MASIKRRPDGSWRARYRDAAGKEHAKHAATKAKAQQWLDQQISSLVTGTHVDPKAGKVTFKAYAKEWLTTKGGVADRTRINVEGRINNYALPHFGEMALQSVRPLDARRYVAELIAAELAPSTIKGIVLSTRQVFAQAVLDGIIVRSPFLGVELPPERHREEMHFLDADQVNVLATAIGDRYRVAVYVAAYGGPRASELWALRLDRVNVLGRTIDVVESFSEVGGQVLVGPTKTGKRRTITVPRFLAELIGEHIGRYSSAVGYVFSAPKGGPVRHHNFMVRVFRPTVAKLEGFPPIRFHDLRHTCAALLIANGRHLEEVKDHLGHSSIRVTSDRYGHLFPKARAELADALDETFANAAPADLAHADLADFSRTTAPVVGRLRAVQGSDLPVRGADDGTRTRDPHLGKVMLYQLSHVRVSKPG
jgi:integrase